MRAMFIVFVQTFVTTFTRVNRKNKSVINVELVQAYCQPPQKW